MKAAKNFDLIEGLKLVYQEGRTYIPEEASSVEKARIASYAISHLIAKQGKPFTEGDFVKKCLIEAVKSFGTCITLEDAESIALGRKNCELPNFLYRRIHRAKVN